MMIFQRRKLLAAWVQLDHSSRGSASRSAANLAVFILSIVLVFSFLPSCDSKPGAIVRSVTAPGFSLKDDQGKTHRLNEFRGRPVVLYLFCGCEWCTRCAQTWGQIQNSGALDVSPNIGKRAVTVVVFAGDSDAAAQFMKKTGLDSGQTVILPDENMHVALDLYHAPICPRVFVISSSGKICYTNNHKSDAPRVASETVITNRALDAVRKLSVGNN